LNYNFFEELFPHELMKTKGIKTVIFKEEDIDNTPTIHIQNDDISTYRFNKDGYLIKKETKNYFFIYERDENNQLVSIFDSAVSYNNEFNFSSMLEFEYDENNLLISEWRAEKYYSSTMETQEQNYRTFYTFDDKNRVIKKTTENGFAWHNSKAPMIINYEYNDINYYRVASTVNSILKDTIFFDEQWRPISSIEEHGIEKEISYNKRNKVDLYREFILTKVAVEIEEGIGKNKFLSSRINFLYDSEGMLEKLIITNIDDTCELKVYYLKE